MSTEVKTVDQLTDEELDQILKEREQKKRAEEQRKIEAYNKERDELVKALIQNSKHMNELLAAFKEDSHNRLEAFYERMKEHGDIHENNKGTFSIKSLDGNLKIEYQKRIIKTFDERAEMAAAHMDQFLQDFVKKKDISIYNLITSLLERSHGGSFDVKLIGRLFQMEDRYDHPEWKKAIQLFKEAYNEYGSAVYVRYFEADPSGRHKTINLNYSSL